MNKWHKQMIAFTLFLLGTACISSQWQGRAAQRWYTGDERLHESLANGVTHWINADMDRTDFTTGSKLFDGEWLFGTHMMAAMGFGQMAILYPTKKEHYLTQMEKAIEVMLSDRVRAFDRERWGNDPLEMLHTDEAHGAYLGYMNLAMGLHRQLNPQSTFSELNDQQNSAKWLI